MNKQSVKKFRYPVAEVPRLVRQLRALDRPATSELEIRDLLAHPEMVKAMDHLRKIGYTNDAMAGLMISMGIDMTQNALLLAIRKTFASRNPRRKSRSHGSRKAQPAIEANPPVDSPKSNAQQAESLIPSPPATKQQTLLRIGRKIPESVATRQQRL